jgi:HEAT repeat protein
MRPASATGEAAVAKLVALLQAPNEDARAFAAVRLGRLGAKARAAVPALRALLQSAVAGDRQTAAAALALIESPPSDRAA